MKIGTIATMIARGIKAGIPREIFQIDQSEEHIRFGYEMISGISDSMIYPWDNRLINVVNTRLHRDFIITNNADAYIAIPDKWKRMPLGQLYTNVRFALSKMLAYTYLFKNSEYTSEYDGRAIDAIYLKVFESLPRLMKLSMKECIGGYSKPHYLDDYLNIRVKIAKKVVESSDELFHDIHRPQVNIDDNLLAWIDCLYRVIKANWVPTFGID